MSVDDIIRAWKDPDRRPGSAHDDGHPAGEIALEHTGGDAAAVTGGALTFGCCETQQGCTHPWGGPETVYGTCDIWTIGCCELTLV